MASDSDSTSQIEIPIIMINDPPRRRSSIFRPNQTECTVYNTSEIFPPNYKDELLKEPVKWNEAYANIKSELMELKKKKQTTVQPVPSAQLADYQMYLRKAEDFCNQAKCLADLHEHAINYLNIRRRELHEEAQATSQLIRDKLNQ